MTNLANRGIGKNAPELKASGDKWNYKGTYEKNERPNGYYFGQCPTIIRDYVLNHLTGNNGNPLKLMWVLLETDEKAHFKISQKWVLNKTGMPKDKYYDARKKLEIMGWLDYDQNEESIIINYDYLWQEALEFLEREKEAE